MSIDADTVAAQLGRVPRGVWRVVARCSFGRPVVIETAPVLTGGEPFPTLYYLTCPHLGDALSALESGGEVARWRERIAGDAELAAALRAVDAVYRAERARAAGGADPTPCVGIAGQRDPLAVKCLHAHVAAALAGLDDPVGAGVLTGVVRECTDDRCRRDG